MIHLGLVRECFIRYLVVMTFECFTVDPNVYVRQTLQRLLATGETQSSAPARVLNRPRRR
jgi:hypothetical protein